MKINLATPIYEWGASTPVKDALIELKHDIIITDYRNDPGSVPSSLLEKDYDILLALRGESLPPQILKKVKKPKILWHAEIIHQNEEEKDEISLLRLNRLKYNIDYFDLILHHDYTALDTIRKITSKKVIWVHLMAVNPKVFKKLNINKEYDIGFIGIPSKRRLEICRAIKKVTNLNCLFVTCYDPFKTNRLINQCKIFLNIHFTNILNTEARIHECLGAGTFMLTEELSMPDLYKDGEHLVNWKRNDFHDLIYKISYYLKNESEREEIATKGHKYAYENYRYIDTVKDMLKIIKNNLNLKS
ncbi:MAG: glycosyltransferase [bacterium]|nr:glycosyltransferase [bacterium]